MVFKTFERHSQSLVKHWGEVTRRWHRYIACLYFEGGELFSAQATFEDALDIYRDVFPAEKAKSKATVIVTSIKGSRRMTLCSAPV
jgi:hypothetical protein